MKAKPLGDELTEQEIARLRDEGIRRALNTPHKPDSAYVGKTERAKKRQKS